MQGRQRARELALIAPLIGVLLLLSPLTSIFSRTATLFGVPLIALYIFGVWVGLIVVAFLLARWLRGTE